ARIPYEVPAAAELGERLDAVLRVIYLVFNEGYSASSGESATRADLSAEALRLARLLAALLPEPEAMGLLALMLLHESRGAHLAERGPDSARASGPEQVGPKTHRRRHLAGGGGALLPALRPLQPAGGHLGGARRGARGRGDRLGADRGALRRARAPRPLAGRSAEPRRGARDARRPRGRTFTCRGDPGKRRSARL